MSAEASNQGWPEYFDVHEVGQGDGQPGLPTALVDAFYLQPNARDTVFVGVAGDSQGGLQTIVGDVVPPEFDVLGDQIEALRIGHRNTFRGIAAAHIGVMSVEAISQDFATQGFNDPVTIAGQLAMTTVQGPEHNNASRQGTMSVGRLDLLMAYREGLAHRFRSMDPNNTNAFMVPFLLSPTSSYYGSGDLVLAYPAFGPATYEFGDNTSIARHIVYDLLLSVQKDLVEEGVDHPFIHEQIPVPNRQRLESELSLDGYEIRGNEAVKSGQPSGERRGLIAHLRAFTKDWAADRILLPPEATDDDYAQIIDSLLPYIQSRQDHEAAAAILHRVTPQVVGRATLAQPGIFSSGQASTIGHQLPTHQSPIAQPPILSGRPHFTPPPRPDYTSMFADTNTTQSEADRRAAARRQWEGMFDVSRMQVRNVPPQHSGQVSHGEGDSKWGSLFNSESASTQGSQARSDRWADIFEDQSGAQPALSHNWAGVFSTSSGDSEQHDGQPEAYSKKDPKEDDGNDDWLQAYRRDE